MTTTVTGTEEVMTSAGDRVQYLPCSIDFTGTTQIQQRFDKFSVKDEEKDTMTNSLRGFPLNGKNVSLPDGFTGLVVEVGKSGLTKQNKQARVTSTFQEMTVWNYDREPSDTDPWHQALSWSKVAAVIHED